VFVVSPIKILVPFASSLYRWRPGQPRQTEDNGSQDNDSTFSAVFMKQSKRRRVGLNICRFKRLIVVIQDHVNWSWTKEGAGGPHPHLLEGHPTWNPLSTATFSTFRNLFFFFFLFYNFNIVNDKEGGQANHRESLNWRGCWLSLTTCGPQLLPLGPHLPSLCYKPPFVNKIK
jgi:hypothetical protein